MAIVSSKNVNLQQLADEGLINSTGYYPGDEAALQQWLLPDGLQSRIPTDPILLYRVFCYDYDVQNDEAIFLICQSDIGKKKNNPREPVFFSEAILERRTADQIRRTERIIRVQISPLNLLWSLDDLVQKSDEWDVADVWIRNEDELHELDSTGLLYDFAQDIYWSNRKPKWSMPKGIENANGNIIAIPYEDWD